VERGEGMALGDSIDGWIEESRNEKSDGILDGDELDVGVGCPDMDGLLLVLGVNVGCPDIEGLLL